MMQVRWIAFQIVILCLTYWWFSTWVDDDMLATSLYFCIAASFVATGLLVRFIDRVRVYRVRVADERQRQIGSTPRGGASPRQLPQHPGRTRIGQDRR